MKKFLLLAIVFFGLLGVSYGQTIVPFADVTVTTCSGAGTQVLPASTFTNTGQPNRICAILTNTGALSARCGDATVDATHGMNVSGTTGALTLCVAGPIFCCGSGGSTTIGGGYTLR